MGVQREAKERTQVFPVGDSRTKQEFTKDCDINLIVKKYEKSGILSHLNRGKPSYVDNGDSVSLHEAMDKVMEAEGGFANLPAAVRDAANGDPVQLLEMLESEEGARVLEDAGMQLNLPAIPVERAPESPAPETPVAAEPPPE